MKVCECMCVYYRMSVLSLFFSSFFFAPNIHIHTHIHTKHTFTLSLKNRLCEIEDCKAGDSAFLIIHTLTHTHTLKGDVHG